MAVFDDFACGLDERGVDDLAADVEEGDLSAGRVENENG